MYTKQDLMNALEQLGVHHDSTVFVHSSMKAIGPVEGGADTVLAALTEYLAEGLLLFPTHTWAWMGDGGGRVFDAAKDPSCVGLLSNMAMKLPGAVRSLHPDHSCVAVGRDAAEYVKGDEGADTPLPRHGTMGQLIDRKGIILLVGCSVCCNTFLHCVEEIEQIPDRIAEETLDYTIIAPDGRRWVTPFHRHHCRRDGVSETYYRAVPALLESGAMWTGKFGDAVVYAERADLVYNVTAGLLRQNPDFFLPEEERS